MPIPKPSHECLPLQCGAADCLAWRKRCCSGPDPSSVRGWRRSHQISSRQLDLCGQMTANHFLRRRNWTPLTYPTSSESEWKMPTSGYAGLQSQCLRAPGGRDACESCHYRAGLKAAAPLRRYPIAQACVWVRIAAPRGASFSRFSCSDAGGPAICRLSS
jgi:hypothetical protein